MMSPTEFNCLDFRREKLADPKRLSRVAQAHLRGCAACQDFARRIDANEARIGRVLAVEVPEGLADRVLLRVHHGQRRPWKLWALAASVVLSFGIGIEQWQPRPAPDPARLAIEHVLHEPAAFAEHRLADPSGFRYVLANFGGELRGSLGTVRYMKLCPVPQGTGWHVVIDTAAGEVTLFLIPGQRIERSTLDTAFAGYVARMLPGGQGQLAIVARSSEVLDSFERQLDSNVRWKT